MALWQQLKAGKIVHEIHEDGRIRLATGIDPESAYKNTQVGPIAGKAVISSAVQKISELWDEVEHSGGALAWEWILRTSHHGAKIRKAEELVDAVGSKGDPAALLSACNAWVDAWRDGIEAWGKRRRKP